MDEKESFLSRWSRRKLQPDAEPPAPEAAFAETGTQAAAAGPAAADAAPCRPGGPVPGPELPSVESLDGLRSEYQGFLKAEVDENLRRTALKKLFSDPHFNVMDGLDTYIDDYSLPDPIPAAMLRQLHQAKALFLFDDEEKESARGGDGLAAGDAEAPAAPPVSDASPQAELPAPAAAATDADAADSAARIQSKPSAAS